MQKCSVGEITQSDCHLSYFVKKSALQTVQSLSEADLTLLKLRIETSEELNSICLHHQYVYLNKYEFLQKVCCDPYKRHKTSIKKTLRPVSLEQSMMISNLGFKVKPGQKLCVNCCNKIFVQGEYITEDIFEENHAEGSSFKDDVLNVEENKELSLLERKRTAEELNSSFQEIGCSPIKLHALPEEKRIWYGKKKLHKVQENVKERIQTILEVNLPEIKVDLEDSVVKKSQDLDKLIDVMKTELKDAPRNKQIQILTIPAALNWSKRKIIKDLNATDYSVRQAIKLFQVKGFLSTPEARCGRKLSSETLEVVKNFYQSEENTRILPGMKDVVSVRKKVYERKRLILCNLRELYLNFISAHPHLKIGLSKFCSLRPKWCVLAGASGTHLVCVCTIHQNVILLLNGAGIEESYKTLMAFIVCPEPKRECMLQHCDDCPNRDELTQFLESKFEDNDIEDLVQYSQWVSTDRTEMIRCSNTVGEFIELFVEKLYKLVPHAFIAKSQASFFKTLKESAYTDTAIISMDFSENYSFQIQEEAQGYHWTTNSCTIHPVMIHCKDACDKKILSLCIISDDLKHDVSMVFKIQDRVTSFIKEKYPHIKSIHYFSDGCAGQYKNKYNLINLCFHQKDFHLKAQWSFHATSHGKTECDGIGGAVKCAARKESMQRKPGKEMITTSELLEFCRSRFKNIHFLLITKEEVDAARKFLEDRFQLVQTLPGTRTFHNFRPLDDLKTIEARRISCDEEPALTFNLCSRKAPKVKLEDLYSGCFIASIYDHLWYLGMVKEVNNEEKDVVVSFMHPNGPSPSFFWPEREDVCAIPIPHVLMIVEPPVTSTGRTYKFTQDVTANINLILENTN